MPAEQTANELTLAAADPVEEVDTQDSSGERLRLLLEQTPEKPEPFRFHIADLLIVSAGVSFGFAGGTWIRSDVFSLILGLIMLAGIVRVSLHPLESHRAAVWWVTLCLSYVASIIAAFVRSPS